MSHSPPFARLSDDKPSRGSWAEAGKRVLGPFGVVLALVMRPPVAMALVASPVLLPQVMQTAIIIDGIDAPTVISDSGYGSEILSRSIKDEMREVFTIARPSRLRLGMSETPVETKIPEIDVAGGFTNLRTVMVTLRELIGYSDTRVTGELVVALDGARPASDDENAPKNYTLILRSSVRGIIARIPARFPDPDFRRSFRQAALAIIETTNPKLAARYYERTNQFENAQRLSQQFLSSPLIEDRIEARLILGMALIRQHRTDEALVNFEQVIAMDPRVERAWSGCSLAYNWSARFAQSVRCADQAIAIDPTEAGAYMFKAMSLVSMGQGQAALDAALLGIQRAEENKAQPMAAAAAALVRLGRYAEALEMADKSVALSPALHAAHRWRGLALLQLDRVDEAIASLKRATELDSAASLNWRNYAQALSRKGLKREAIEAARKARDITPQYAIHWLYFAELLVADRRRSEAITALTEATKRFPSNAQVAALLAGELIAAGDRTKARAVLTQFQDSREPVVIRHLMTLARADSRHAEAARFAGRLVEVQPSNPANHTDLARTRALAGDRPGAIQALEAALTLEGADKERIQRDVERLKRGRPIT